MKRRNVSEVDHDLPLTHTEIRTKKWVGFFQEENDAMVLIEWQLQNLHTIVPSVPVAFKTQSPSACVSNWPKMLIISTVFVLVNTAKNFFKPCSVSTVLPRTYALFPHILEQLIKSSVWEEVFTLTDHHYMSRDEQEREKSHWYLVHQEIVRWFSHDFDWDHRENNPKHVEYFY